MSIVPPHSYPSASESASLSPTLRALQIKFTYLLTERIQEEAGTAKGELDGHHKTQPEEHGHQLGGGRRVGGGQDGVGSSY